MKALNEIIESQKKFQFYMGYDFSKMTPQELAAYTKENMLWTIDELSEMLHELPYAKTWSKKYDSWNEEKLQEQIRLTQEEYIDAFHFMINIGISIGMTEDKIIEMYGEKNQINYKRQENNY